MAKHLLYDHFVLIHMSEYGQNWPMEKIDILFGYDFGLWHTTSANDMEGGMASSNIWARLHGCPTHSSNYVE